MLAEATAREKAAAGPAARRRAAALALASPGLDPGHPDTAEAAAYPETIKMAAAILSAPRDRAGITGKTLPAAPGGPTYLSQQQPHFCHLKRPAQVRWGGPGRFICHRTHVFSTVFGAVIARGLDYRETFQVFQPGFDLAKARQQRADEGKPEWFGEDDLYPDARSALARLRAGGLWVGIAGNQTRRAGGILRSLGRPVSAPESVSAGQRPAGCPAKTP